MYMYDIDKVSEICWLKRDCDVVSDYFSIWLCIESGCLLKVFIDFGFVFFFLYLLIIFLLCLLLIKYGIYNFIFIYFLF